LCTDRGSGGSADLRGGGKKKKTLNVQLSTKASLRAFN
jgi:hypothetical protein